MQPKLRSLAAALLTAAILSPFAACSSASDGGPELAQSQSALKKIDDDDPGDPGPEDVCGDCVPDAASPQGGYMTCTVIPKKRACIPPGPPPPPPGPTCTTTTAGGTCYRLCCTPAAGGRRCSALKC